MSKGWAIVCGVASLFLFSILVYDAGSEAWTGKGLPRFVTSLIILAIAVLSNAATVYLVVRGRRPDPAHTNEELEDLVEGVSRRVFREELEMAAGRTFVDLIDQDSRPRPRIPSPRPSNVVKLAREGDSLG